MRKSLFLVLLAFVLNSNSYALTNSVTSIAALPDAVENCILDDQTFAPSYEEASPKKCPKYCSGMVSLGKDKNHKPAGCDAKCNTCPKDKDGNKRWCKWDGRIPGWTCQFDGE